MSRNKAVTVYALVIMIFTLVACGTSTTITDKQSTYTTQTETAKTETPKPVVVEEKTIQTETAKTETPKPVVVEEKTIQTETTKTDTPKPVVVEEKTVSDKKITITVENPDKTIEIDGYYTGDVKNGKPEGKGKFAYWDNNDTYSMVYEGEFSSGTFNGKGKETEKEGERNIVRVYEGEFKNGNYDGYGTMTITNTKEGYTYDVIGNFTKGEFTPTAGQAFDYIGRLAYFGRFSVSNKLIEYFDNHKELFPTCEKATADATDLVNFTYKQFTKTRKQDEIGLIKLNLTAQQVFEDDLLDGKLTSVLARDSDHNYYAIYYRDSVEVYDGDTFTVYAIPCATSSFENVGGGTTTVIVLLACCMQ